MYRIPVFDAHCDTISRCLKTGEGLTGNHGMVELGKTERAFSRYCQIFALFSDCGRPEHATYDQLLACFHAQLEAHAGRARHCRSMEDVRAAHKRGRLAAFLSVEGGELLDCDPERLEQAAADGVVAINLTWNHANALSGSCREEPERGLSEQGKRFARQMQKLGILIDVSHLSDPGFWDVMELARRPIIASHSNARAVCPHTRNLTDEQITAIIKNQGVIGLNFCRSFVGLTEDLEAVRAHLDHILDLGGERQAALGGDWDGCETIPALPAVEHLSALYDHLFAHGYSESLLQDLFYNNLMRVVRQR